ncbi:MAG: hypothetical protein KDK76_03405 [Chlamydiia bacterium]|nr:hypothetical protein [Chlamydiia bacterium]
MRKKNYRAFLILGVALLGLFYIPKGIIEKLRSTSVDGAKHLTFQEKGEDKSLETQLLLLEKQNEDLRNRLLCGERIKEQIDAVKSMIAIDEKELSEFSQRRIKSAEELLKRALFFVSGDIIYRDPSHWNSTFWINLGEKEISVNSPVLKGKYLIGLVEYVGKHKSRVRLLTDSSLVPSVRVVRGEGKDQKYLAKGELYGSSSPLWRKRSDILSGIGFNYDFEDEEGGARELRSGRPLNHLNHEDSLSLIEVGDLLVTTGMDGVFPKDIPVAIVSKLETLREGAVSIEIEARLCCGNLDNLQSVAVLPPLIPFEGEK